MMAAWSAGRRPWRGADRTLEASAVRSALDWPALFLPTIDPRTAEAQRYLLDWIWAQTEGEGFSDLCRRRGWRRRTALNLITWALDLIVYGLTLDEAARDRAGEHGPLDSCTTGAGPRLDCQSVSE
jgi:hypothetical protein